MNIPDSLKVWAYRQKDPNAKYLTDEQIARLLNCSDEDFDKVAKEIEEEVLQAKTAELIN